MYATLWHRLLVIMYSSHEVAYERVMCQARFRDTLLCVPFLSYFSYDTVINLPQ